MLIDFQCALADLTASPTLCQQIRNDPYSLRNNYKLTNKEWRQIVGIVSSRGMQANCMLYRANRLAPIALNMPNTCRALGDRLNSLISAYWDSEPITNVHFLVEAERFCEFLFSQDCLSSEVQVELKHEYELIMAKLSYSRLIGKIGW